MEKNWEKGERKDTEWGAKTQRKSGVWEKREEENLTKGEAWRLEGLRKSTVLAI